MIRWFLVPLLFFSANGYAEPSAKALQLVEAGRAQIGKTLFWSFTTSAPALPAKIVSSTSKSSAIIVTSEMLYRIALPVLVFLSFALPSARSELPFDTVFKGRAKFDELVARADAWKSLPIGERTAAVGRALVGTPYKNFTLEIDDHVEAPSVNLTALDCWTFFEASLAFARMLDEPREQWTPETMLKQIERDRYRGGQCDGTYLSRLHYLEEWQLDNARRGLIRDLTRELGGVRTRHVTGEMSIKWRSYRYIRANPSLRPAVHAMEQRVKAIPMWHIPKKSVARIEPQLRNGDIISITTNDPGGTGTSHVGLAYRSSDGVLHFMHASHPRNYGKVVVDSRLSTYLQRYRTIAGIMVARPVR